MNIDALEEMTCRLRSGDGCADEAADLIDEAIGEIERLRQIVSALAVPVGWQLVPVRPTPEMVEATFTTGAGEATRRVQRRHRASLYRKMLGAAPAQTHTVQIEAPDAALSRQVASNAGLGLDGPERTKA